MKSAVTLAQAHLVGSIGLDTVDDVFRVVGSKIGPYLRRIPDGEVGGRKMWTSWQYSVLRAHPLLGPDPSGAVRPTNRFPLLTLVSLSTRPEELRFGELGYSREARASYVDFVAARNAGTLPKGIRFQVCLPTPFAVISANVARDVWPVVEPAYEKAMIREIEAICKHIPHQDLCIQLDVCNEMVLWDGQKTAAVPMPDEPKDRLLRPILRLAASIPADVEVGIHLCYGDFAGKHFIEPKDANAMVEFANAIAAATPHKLAYFHMPVPIGSTDDAFFRPYQNLRLPAGTELYLGIVHAKDGITGAMERAKRAARYAPKFGIATECGMARARTEETVMSLLDIHADIFKES
jgi:methionine synthase II (cobalamin-independent)